MSSGLCHQVTAACAMRDELSVFIDGAAVMVFVVSACGLCSQAEVQAQQYQQCLK